MSQVNPPFRADHVGSLLRPTAVHEARAACAAGEITAGDLRDVEDAAIAEAVRTVEGLGMRSITDGEFRRTWFHLDFLQQLEGVAVTGSIAASSDAATTVHLTPPKLSVVGPLRHVRDIQVDDYPVPRLGRPRRHRRCRSPRRRWSTSAAAGRRSTSTPIRTWRSSSPTWPRATAPSSTPSMRRGAATCSSTTPTSPTCATRSMRAGAVERGEDPDQLPHAYAELINAVIDGRPDDLVVGIHLCRGNYRSTWFAEGGYEPVAEVLFNELDVDAYFLEYDDERSGDFAPLRFVPADKTVVLGLVTSKRPELESVDELATRIDEAAVYVPLDQLCLSPAVRVRQHRRGQRS